VAYCPDQLGPSVSRLLPDGLGLTQLTFPKAQSPQVVDWVDYRATIRQTDVLRFAWTVLDRAGPDHNVWYVWSIGYKSVGKRCEQLLHALGDYRNWTDQVRINWGRPEHLGLIRFAPVDLDAGPFTHRCNRPPGC
jgi:mannosyltransferase